MASSVVHIRTTSIISGENLGFFEKRCTEPASRWKPFDPSRNFPDLGPRFKKGEDLAHSLIRKEKLKTLLAAKAKTKVGPTTLDSSEANDAGEEPDTTAPDKVDLDWATVLKRTFEAYIRGEQPNMYGEWIEW